jgi:hypothetical protein
LAGELLGSHHLSRLLEHHKCANRGLSLAIAQEITPRHPSRECGAEFDRLKRAGGSVLVADMKYAATPVSIGSIMPACSALKHTTRVEVLGGGVDTLGTIAYDHACIRRVELRGSNRSLNVVRHSGCPLPPLGTPLKFSLASKPHTSAKRVEHVGTAWGQMRYDEMVSRTSFGKAGTMGGSSTPAHQCSQWRHSTHSCATPKPAR